MATATEARVGRPVAGHALASVQGYCGPPWGQQGRGGGLAWVAVAVILTRVIVNLKVPVHLPRGTSL